MHKVLKQEKKTKDARIVVYSLQQETALKRSRQVEFDLFEAAINVLRLKQAGTSILELFCEVTNSPRFGCLPWRGVAVLCNPASHQSKVLLQGVTRGYKDGLQPETLADGNCLVKQNQPVSRIETKSDTNLRSLYES